MIVEEKTDKKRTPTFSSKSKRGKLLLSLPRFRYQEFKKILLSVYSQNQLKEVNFDYFEEFPYIKEILKLHGWETKEIKDYYDYWFMVKDRMRRSRKTSKKKRRVKRSYTKDQIDKIKTLNKNKKGKTFDRSGKVIDKVRVFQGGSTGLGKKK